MNETLNFLIFTFLCYRTNAAEPRLFVALKGIFFGIKALIKSIKFFTPEIKGGLCIVKYMLILEDPALAHRIDIDGIAKWVHTLRLYISDLINPNRVEEETTKLFTRQRIETKLRESLQYDGKKSNVDNLVAIAGDEIPLDIPKNVTNYANEGQSYDSVYPKCSRISFRGKMTNLPCAPNENMNVQNGGKNFPLATIPKMNYNHPKSGGNVPKYYENDLRIVNMVMNYMELQPNQLINLNISHCLNFYAFGLLTRLIEGIL